MLPPLSRATVARSTQSGIPSVREARLDVAAVARRRDAGGRVATLVLTRCAPPTEALEPATMSDAVSCPDAGVTTWEAFWAGDERYLLRALRHGGSEEWYALTLEARDAERADATGYAVPDVDASAAPVRGTPRTMLLGWQPLGRGNAARWSVVWRRM